MAPIHFFDDGQFNFHQEREKLFVIDSEKKKHLILVFLEKTCMKMLNIQQGRMEKEERNKCRVATNGVPFKCVC